MPERIEDEDGDGDGGDHDGQLLHGQLTSIHGAACVSVGTVFCLNADLSCEARSVFTATRTHFSSLFHCRSS